MARPSVKAERRAQVLSAFGRCLARYGLEGATLERVAEEAGLARALIRHNVGNRDQLIDAFLADFVAQSKAGTKAMIAALPSSRRSLTLIEWLFDPDFVDAEGTAIGAALLAAVDQHPGLADAMAQWNEDFVSALAAEFEAESAADAEAMRQVAVGIAAIYANAEALAAIDQDDELRRDSLGAALRLAGTLDGLSA